MSSPYGSGSGESQLRIYEGLTEIWEALPADKEEIFTALIEKIRGAIVRAPDIVEKTLGAWIEVETSNPE
jgi:hypothetical protein